MNKVLKCIYRGCRSSGYVYTSIPVKANCMYVCIPCMNSILSPLDQSCTVSYPPSSPFPPPFSLILPSLLPLSFVPSLPSPTPPSPTFPSLPPLLIPPPPPLTTVLDLDDGLANTVQEEMISNCCSTLEETTSKSFSSLNWCVLTEPQVHTQYINLTFCSVGLNFGFSMTTGTSSAESQGLPPKV